VLPALRDLYDDIWIYGLPQMCDPLAGIALPRAVKRKISYTGYLHRHVPVAPKSMALEGFGDEPYILVTPGGGGDGDALVDWVLRAYEHDRRLPYRAVVVLGPFMQSELQAEFMQRAESLRDVRVITFDAHLETLIAEAAGVVAMGGYNTFCEILSFDKRAILVPRTTPRLEQFIRAQQANELGLARMLPDDGRRDAQVMARALRELPAQRQPSETVIPGLLDGLANVDKLAGRWMNSRGRRGTVAHLAYARE
jgi:predicted glycosyltransferase